MLDSSGFNSEISSKMPKKILSKDTVIPASKFKEHFQSNNFENKIKIPQKKNLITTQIKQSQKQEIIYKEDKDHEKKKGNMVLSDKIFNSNTCLNLENKSKFELKDKIINQKTNDDVQIIFVPSNDNNLESDNKSDEDTVKTRSRDSLIDNELFNKKTFIDSSKDLLNNKSDLIENENKTLNLQVISLPTSKYYIDSSNTPSKKQLSLNQINMHKANSQSLIKDHKLNLNKSFMYYYEFF